MHNFAKSLKRNYILRFKMIMTRATTLEISLMTHKTRHRRWQPKLEGRQMVEIWGTPTEDGNDLPLSLLKSM